MAGTSVVSRVDGAMDMRARIGGRVQTGMDVVDGITTVGTEVKDVSLESKGMPLKRGFVSTGQ